MSDDVKAKARQRGSSLANRPTQPMLDFLAILLNDYLSSETERAIKFLDDLTFDEAKRIINDLKERRDRDKHVSREHDE